MTRWYWDLQMIRVPTSWYLMIFPSPCGSENGHGFTIKGADSQSHHRQRPSEGPKSRGTHLCNGHGKSGVLSGRLLNHQEQIAVLFFGFKKKRTKKEVLYFRNLDLNGPFWNLCGKGRGLKPLKVLHLHYYSPKGDYLTTIPVVYFDPLKTCEVSKLPLSRLMKYCLKTLSGFSGLQ